MMAERQRPQLPRIDASIYKEWERQTSTTPANTFTTKTPSSTLNTPTPRNRLQTPKGRGLARGRYSLETQRDEAAERKRILELRILSTKSAIAGYQHRVQELVRENIGMKRKIEQQEKPDHQAVKTLLRRYEKFRGGMSYLSENFTMTLGEEQQSLAQLKAKLDAELSAIENEVRFLDECLREQQTQVHVLNNYKDKEYPVKAIKIAELMKELDEVELNNEDEVYDLESIIGNELHKLSAAGHHTETELKETAIDKALYKMHPSVKEMAKQNQVMESEIHYHDNMLGELTDEIARLKSEVKELLAHPKTNMRLQVFPELFKYQTKCTPDMDVVLDIPTVQTLPL